MGRPPHLGCARVLLCLSVLVCLRAGSARPNRGFERGSVFQNTLRHFPHVTVAGQLGPSQAPLPGSLSVASGKLAASSSTQVLASRSDHCHRLIAVSSVRLVGGGSPLQGRLEVNFGGTWGAVCATGFDNSDAVVVCRQLRLAGGVASGRFKRGTLPFSIAGVRCSGKETGLSGCRYTSTRACASGKAVGVICKSEWAASRR